MAIVLKTSRVPVCLWQRKQRGCTKCYPNGPPTYGPGWFGLTVELANGRRGVVEGGGHGYFEVRMNERPAAGEPVVVKKRAHELQLVREKSRISNTGR